MRKTWTLLILLMVVLAFAIFGCSMAAAYPNPFTAKNPSQQGTITTASAMDATVIGRDALTILSPMPEQENICASYSNVNAMINQQSGQPIVLGILGGNPSRDLVLAGDIFGQEYGNQEHVNWQASNNQAMVNGGGQVARGNV